MSCKKAKRKAKTATKTSQEKQRNKRRKGNVERSARSENKNLLLLLLLLLLPATTTTTTDEKKSKFCVHRDLTNAFTARETIPVVFERSVSREFQVLDFDAARLSRRFSPLFLPRG